MRISKKRLAVAAALFAAISLSFAGGGKETKAEPGVTTLKWARWDINSTTYYKPLIEAYEAAHPNVKIEMLDLSYNFV